MEVKHMRTPGKTKVFYFFGKFTFSLFAAMEMYYFASYMTDAALLPTTIVALVLNIPSVVDLIFSFLNGVILEKLHLPIGKYRFWLIVGPIIATITYAICFIRFESDMVTGICMIVMMILAHFFWSMAETAYNALPTLLTDEAAERSSLSMLFGTAANWSGALYGLIAMPLIGLFNGATNSKTMGYLILVVIIGILYIVSYTTLALHVTYAEKEEEAQRAKGGNVKEAVKGPSGKAMMQNITKNGPLIVLLLYNLVYFTVIFTQTTLMFYYFQYCLAAVAMMGVVMTLRSVATIVTTFIFGPLMKLFKGNKKSVVLLGNIVNLIFMVAMWAIRPTITVFIVGTIISAIIGGVASMPAIAMFADCADYGEYKTGVDAKAFVMSLYNVPVKIGLTIKGFIVSAVLAMIAYDATATDAASLARFANGFNNGYMLLGAILTLVGILILAFGYHLNEKKVAECIAETNARKQKNG